MLREKRGKIFRHQLVQAHLRDRSLQPVIVELQFFQSTGLIDLESAILLRPLWNEIDPRADRCRSNVQSLQNFLVLGENIL